MKSIFRKILFFFGLEAISRLVFQQSSLKDDGWYLSVKKKQAINKEGKPIPWLTYPFIDFITPRLNTEMKVFEYGAGNSSLFYASRVHSVTSIEHSKEWFEIISKNDEYKLKNLTINLVEVPESLKDKEYHELAFTDDENEYVYSIKSNKEKFDIIIVDGLFRNSCICYSLEYLSEAGVIFVDNTHTKYQAQLKIGTDFLAKHGFRRIDFWGMGPIYSAKSCTSIFYRENNVFNI